ncbi:unnamed protein product [Calicophoron daubneyi]|uniref:Uncharacterized protein n=1 Tax=Calicophoron daubneyi TaxID=300641 RepID=A0AAV2TW99_CALDB
MWVPLIIPQNQTTNLGPDCDNSKSFMPSSWNVENTPGLPITSSTLNSPNLLSSQPFDPSSSEHTFRGPETPQFQRNIVTSVTQEYDHSGIFNKPNHIRLLHLDPTSLKTPRTHPHPTYIRQTWFTGETPRPNTTKTSKRRFRETSRSENSMMNSSRSSCNIRPGPSSSLRTCKKASVEGHGKPSCFGATDSQRKGNQGRRMKRRRMKISFEKIIRSSGMDITTSRTLLSIISTTAAALATCCDCLIGALSD